MPSLDTKVVLSRLEGFRRNLLDISLRNRLINFRTQTKAGKPLEKVIEIFGEDPVELHRILVVEGKSMSFTGRPDPLLPRKANSSFEVDDFGDPETLAVLRLEAENEIDTYLRTGEEIVDATDLKLNTHDTVSALQRKLTKIFRDARIGIEEQGVNILFLALGTLEWYEADNSEEVRRAPLIMLPVLLDRTNAGAFRLKWDGGEPGTNLSISAKLKAEFGIRIPEMLEEFHPAQYFRDVKSAIRSQSRWSVNESSVALAFFSYAKFLMYRDLDSGTWPEDRKPKDHDTLGSLLEGGFEENELGLAENTFLDPLRPVQDVCEVFDADGSQTLAILEANTGRTMIIEGPPGTGKSQTITNLIAEAVGAGKKVLFVAEKAAALDVVYRRLKEANLEDACLELHSNKANKRSFYTELKKTVEIAAPKVARSEADLKKLEEDKALLNSYASVVNTAIEPFGVTPRYAIGKLVLLGSEPSHWGRHNFYNMRNWTEESFRERLDLVRRIQEQVARMGRPVDHPYYGCTLNHLLPEDKLDIARKLTDASEAAETFHLSANSLAEALRVELPVRPADVDVLRVCATFVANSPAISGVSIRSDWKSLEAGLRRTITDGRNLNRLRAELQGQITELGVSSDVSVGRNLLRFESLTGHPESKSPEELKDALYFLESSADHAQGLSSVENLLAQKLGLARSQTLLKIEESTAIAVRVASAPDVDGMAVSALEWRESAQKIKEALEAVKIFTEAKSRYETILTEDAWKAEIQNDLATLEKYSPNFFRFFYKAFRQALRETNVQFRSPPRDWRGRIGALNAILAARESEAIISAHRGRMSTLFGAHWKGISSDVKLLSEAASWIEEAHLAAVSGRLPLETLVSIERGTSPQEIGRTGEEVRAKLQQTLASIAAFRNALVSVFPRELEGGPGDLNEKVYAFLIHELIPGISDLRPLFSAEAAASSFQEKLALLDSVEEAQTLTQQISSTSEFSGALGKCWAEDLTDWDQAEAILDWILKLYQQVEKGSLPQGLISFFAEECPREGLDAAVHRAQQDRAAALEAIRFVLTLAQLDKDPAVFTEQSIAIQRERLANWQERLEDLPALIRYNSMAAEGHRLGLDETVGLANQWSSAGVRLAEALERSWYMGIIRQAVETNPILGQFDRQSHEEILSEFRVLDDTSLRYNRAKVARAHWQSVPRGTAGGAMGWLNVQFNLRQNHKPIRVAMDKAGEAIQAIKPVFLMSPISVAMYLPADGPLFDLVIFDEASQVKPEDAFGGVLRANQTIVVGDSKQMPPTSFFDKLTSEGLEEEEDDAQDDLSGSMKELESILAMLSARLPQSSPRRRDLRWHYRSRHDALIATSNRLFYDDRLVVFPSPWRSGANAGLILRHDPTTVYGRGGTRKNIEEAKAVAKAAKKHVLESPKLTLGIAAFSKAQQEAILDEIDILRKEDPAFDVFDAAHPFEPLFVKNLENVQGDERDVIFISVGYGRDENKFIPASFGPLNRDGGERRLNVLITRARIKCEIFTNIKAGDVRLSENPSRGVLALRTFLAFADTGSLDVPAATGKEPQSPFEEAVLDRLRANGYDVEPQVGSCGFYIDLAVRHPKQPQRFVLGIECDGAMYHSARTARDRDKLRQQVLEARNWRIHRIWSTDWFNNPDKEFDRLAKAIASATVLTNEEIEEESARPEAFVELERDDSVVVEDQIEPYAICDIKVNLFGNQLHEIWPNEIAGWVTQVVQIESPVHIEEVIRRIREAAGVARAGNRIYNSIEAAVRIAEGNGSVLRRGDFLYNPLQEIINVRSRAGQNMSLKRVEMISAEEIITALQKVIRSSFGIEPNEAMFLASRSLGFDRMTAGMAEKLQVHLDKAIADGNFKTDNSLLLSV